MHARARSNPPISAADLPKGKPRPVLLGDAEAELLLHAGKTLSHVNRINRIPLSSAIAKQAEDILRARTTLPPLPDLPPLRHDGQHQPHKDWDGPFSLPLPPGLAHPDADVGRHPTAGPSSTRERESATLNDGFDGLLQLAQASSQEDLDDSSTLSPRAAKRRRVASVRHGDWTGEVDHGAQDDADLTLPIPPLSLQQAHAAHPYAPLPGPSSGRSRRGTLNVGDNDDPDYLPSPPPGLASTSSAGHGKGRQLGQRLSALDVLAQASASQEASQDDYDGLPLVPSTSGASANAGGKKKSAAARASQIEKKARSPYIKVRCFASSWSALYPWRLTWTPTVEPAGGRDAPQCRHPVRLRVGQRRKAVSDTGIPPGPAALPAWIALGRDDSAGAHSSSAGRAKECRRIRGQAVRLACFL